MKKNELFIVGSYKRVQVSIEISNYRYTPALRDLRGVAWCVQLSATKQDALAKRLEQICDMENLRCDLSTLRKLCDLCANDMRHSINTLQWAAVASNKTKRSITMKLIHEVVEKEKGGAASIFEHWSSILELSKHVDAKGGIKNTRERVFVIERIAAEHGGEERFVSGLHANYMVSLPIGVIRKASSWFLFYDDMQKIIHSLQNWSVQKYASSFFVSLHLSLATHARVSIAYPQLEQTIYQKSKESEETISDVRSCGHFGRQTQRNELVLDILPYIVKIAQPPIKPMNESLYNQRELSIFNQTVSVMCDYGLTYTATMIKDQINWLFTPAIDVLTMFPLEEPKRPYLANATRQLIAHKITLTRVRLADHTPQQQSERITTNTDKIKEIIDTENQKKKKRLSAGAMKRKEQGKHSDVIFTHQDGDSNAVKKKLIGRFRIDQNTDLTSDQLVKLFENVQEIRGVLQIWNSQLTFVSFTKNIKSITGDPLENVLSIVNNTKMTAVNLSSLLYSNGKLEIRNNQNLNLQKTCSAIHDVYFNYRVITGNSFDCGCEIHGIFKWPQVASFPENCIVLYGDLVLEEAPPPFKVLYRLSSLTKLYGFLRVRNTNLETLGFLQNLEAIESGPEAEYTIHIESNHYLRRLDLIKLQSIKSRNTDSIVRIDDEFCVDPAFVQLLAQSKMKEIQDYHVKTFCEADKINNPSIYCRGKLSAVNDRCNRYIGDILYINNDISDYNDIQNYTKVPAADIRKIQQFEMVFGSILIEGSTLKNVSLPNLREIYQVSDASYDIGYGFKNSVGYKAVMKFRRNDFLENISFPNLNVAYQNMYFLHNANLTKDETLCQTLANQIANVSVIGIDAEYDCRSYLP
ncbi:hypothetical protein L3Y34_004531 [Caenorhabditis briggsae]|uniref:Receptor L-domain domain-containing protein n=1 Tax=Caenorhabditis briggsae TaxID=6238 RepID=A0AAE9A9B3_CAEBR|nr:hypothetical protein L3Y34_004531 [Caenorhabditis briggsae]